MKYYKNIENGYIASISTQHGQIEITEVEYNSILSAIKNKPIAPDGYEYKLRENLTLELVEVIEIGEV